MAGEKTKTIKVPGEKKQKKLLVYALSTCAWCRMTKQFLKDNKVEFEYVDVDLANEEDLKKIKEDILSRGGSLSYPTLIVNEKDLVTGFRKDKIKELLEL